MIVFAFCMFWVFVATTFAWFMLTWRHRALVAERDLAELRAELRHQSHVQEARRSLIKELVDARTRRN